MEHKIHIILTPDELSKLPGKYETIIFIDVLRAGTTIVTALANGAGSIVPFNDEKELEALKKQRNSSFLLCGEEAGKPVPGYDLRNSPLSIFKHDVKKKVILLNTSDGTKVLKKLVNYARVFVGALVNSNQVTKKVISLNRDVYLVCAGSNGTFSLEDFLAAGRISYLLKKKGWQGDDLVTAAARIYEDNSKQKDIINLFSHSYNGERLIKLGYYEDILFASMMDIYKIVPVLREGKIILENLSPS